MSVAVMINARSRKGSDKMGADARHILPSARVTVTRSLEDARSFLRDELKPRPCDLLLSGGGDGTAVGLLNELRDSGIEVPAFGVLPLGTGNGWAGEMGAPKALKGLHYIAALRNSAPPLRSFQLLEAEGRLTPFAGTGWDAEIVSDYQKQLALFPAAVRDTQAGLMGYMRSMFTRTLPRHVFGSGPAHVTVINTGEPALRINEHGVPEPMAGGEHGAVLYKGPAGVAGCGTTTELGMGFRAFPFAHAVRGRMAVRVYAATPLEGTRHMIQLWRGVHPIPNSHDWMLTSCRMEFDRDVPLEIGGDVVGDRRSVDFRLASRPVQVVDWAKLRDLYE